MTEMCRGAASDRGWRAGATLPQHELEARDGGGAGARENLAHVLHQAQAVLCVEPEAVRQLPLLDTGRGRTLKRGGGHF